MASHNKLTDCIPSLTSNYTAPPFEIGQKMSCLWRGDVYPITSCGIIGWPRACRDGENKSCLVVTDELVRALKSERSSVFAYWFGVTEAHFSELRRSMGIKREPPKGRKLGSQVKIQCELIGGPYEIPVVSIGEQVDCLRWGTANISGFLGPIRWPGTDRGKRNHSLLVTDELLRALKTESNQAFAYWFGVSTTWTARLRREFAVAGWTDGSKQQNSKKYRCGRKRAFLSAESISRMGIEPDSVIARSLGVSQTLIQIRRKQLGIPPAPRPRKPVEYRRFSDPYDCRRLPQFKPVREEFLRGKTCAACGTHKALTVHHIKPVYQFPELELDPDNLICLCEFPARNCHYRIGHSLDWHCYNPNVVEDAARSLEQIRSRVEMPQQQQILIESP